MVRVNAVFFYFMIMIRHKERQRLSQHGHKNGHFKHVYFNFVICEIRFLKSMFWNKLLKIVALCSPGYNFFYFEFHIPPTHSSAKYVFFHIPPTHSSAKYVFFSIFAAILVAVFYVCSYWNSCFCIFITRFQELSGVLQIFLKLYSLWLGFVLPKQ